MKFFITTALVLLGHTPTFAATEVAIEAAASTGNQSWTIAKDRWSAADEKNYSNFIAALGSSGCNTVDRCMKSASNPYRATDPAGFTWRSDCAEFPYFLRAYFAWKNSLPFSYVNGVKPVGSFHDDRYSPEGNTPTRRHDVVAKSPDSLPKGPSTINTMLDELNSAMFRVDPRLNSANLFSDFYSQKIDRQSIRPGSMVYDPAGHVIVIYKIEDDGRLLYFDAHPDHSVSHSVYGEKFVRSRPGQGAGFKNWRPQMLVGAQSSAQGLVGGHIVAATNEQIPDFSVEQYFGNKPSSDGKWSKGLFVIDGQPAPLGYYDFVRTKMAVGDLKYEPVEEMKNMLTSLCQDLQDRLTAVQTAIDHGIQNASHPSKLPNNIYGTDGDWETFSSPSRDARLKTSFSEVLTSTKKYVEMYRQHDPRIQYVGANLAQDLRTAYTSTTAACSVTYKNSNKQDVTVGYEDLVRRVYLMSFDPYHCAELRWGASGSELQTCKDDQNKMAWYAGEQRLRNQVERTYNAKMSFDLQDLNRSVPGSGIDQAPDVDLGRYLGTL